MQQHSYFFVAKDKSTKDLKMNFFIIFAAVIVVSTAINPPDGEYKVFGNYYAWNNGWNDPNKILKAEFGTGTSPQMTVSFNYPNKGLYGYPAICRGWHYNVNPIPSDTLFPRQISATANISVTFSYTSNGTNVAGDFAYDIFFRWDTNEDTPQLEVMIWGDHNSWPLGSQTATNVITAGGRTFDMWEGWNSGAGYYVYSFVPHGTVGNTDPQTNPLATTGSLNLDVKPFLNWLQTNRVNDGHYSDSMYLHVVEAGFEVVQGNGSVNIKAAITAE